MNETRIPGQELQDEILKTVRKSQEAVVDAIKAWADTFRASEISLRTRTDGWCSPRSSWLR